MGILSFLLLPEIFLVISARVGTFMRSYSRQSPFPHSRSFPKPHGFSASEVRPCEQYSTSEEPWREVRTDANFLPVEMRCRTVEVYTLLFALLLDNINQFICIRKFHLCITEYNHIAASRQCFFTSSRSTMLSLPPEKATWKQSSDFCRRLYIS